MKIYSQIADYLQYISPQFYKTRFFKKLVNLSANNINDRKIEPEFLWVKNTISNQSVFIDIGANVGAYIFLLEEKLAPQNIFAFEPNPILNNRLKRIFPKINTHHEALSDTNTEAEFKIPIIKGEKIHTRGTLQTNYKELNEEKTILQKVQVRRLDDFKINSERIDFIKIDVEGNEMKTLRGAQQTIAKYKPTLMVEMEQRHHKEPLWDLITEIEGWDYSANYLDRNTLKLEKLSQELILLQNQNNIKNYKLYINNIIFLPNK